MRPLIHQFDHTITSFVTSCPAWMHPIFLGITALGSPVATLSIGATVFIYGLWRANIPLAISGAAVWITLGIGSIIKIVVGRERPLTDYASNLPLGTLSFPSGHTSGATIAYGLLAYLLWHFLPQPWNYIAAAALVLLIILIGISRIYLGAHFPSDVVAGWVLGGVVLAVVALFVQPLIA